MIESGFDNFEAIAWIGFLVRSGTPSSVVQRYHGELTKILQMPEVRTRLAEMQFEVAPGTPGAFSAFMKEEIARWGAVIKATGVTAE